MKKILRSIIDFYLNNALLLDLLVCFSIFFIPKYFVVFSINLTQKANQIELISSLTSTLISLSGFILAAVTIISSIKANIINSPKREIFNALNSLFSNENYSAIISTFKKAIYEQIIGCIFLYLVWINSDSIDIYVIANFGFCGIFIVLSTISRSLLILFKIIKVESLIEERSSTNGGSSNQ